MSSWAACAAGAVALAVAIMLAIGWAAPGAEIVDVVWLPTLGSRLALRLDPLAAPIAVFTAALVVPIFVYMAAYLPVHLREAGRRPGETLR